jgi:hypothetical protein
MRLALSDNDAVKETPLKVHLKADEVCRTAETRRYTPEHRELMKDQFKLLEHLEFIRRNSQKRWCSLVRLLFTEVCGLLWHDCETEVF